MKVIILSTSAYGTTGHHLPALHACPDVEIAMVIVSEGQISNRKNQYLRRIKKILKIGLRGAMNGVKMRKWFLEQAQSRNPHPGGGEGMHPGNQADASPRRIGFQA